MVRDVGRLLLAAIVALVVALEVVARPPSSDSSARLAPVRGAARSSPGSVRAIVCRIFRAHCAEALRVEWCESRGRARAVGAQGERGLFQIHPVHFAHWPASRARRLFEPRYNARVAFRLSDGGRDWTAWTCKP